jgi:hypothetical protein
MECLRKPTILELRLIEFLLNKSCENYPPHWQNELFILPMEDGNMGSLSSFPTLIIPNNRKMGKQVSELLFEDKDGVTVIASLNLDTEGLLFELDIWKTDFSPLLEFPNIDNMVRK